MNADILLTGIAQLVTPEGPGPKRGAAMGRLKIVPNAALAIAGGSILYAGPARDWTGTSVTTIDLNGRAVVPGLVDPHTHALWAGDRLADFDARLSGVPYEQILANGGGIWSTIRATAAASSRSLLAATRFRVQALLDSGATTIEIKSGYGFTVAAELAHLRVLRELAHSTPARIVPTLLIHVPPQDPARRAAHIDEVCTTLIPAVAAEQLASAVDVFVEKEAWSAAEAETILRVAQAHGLAVKLHTEQFHRVGGLELALRLGTLSVDHLEACSSEQVTMFGTYSADAPENVTDMGTNVSAVPGNATATGTTPPIATLLPGVSLHLGLPPAPGRALIDAGAAVAVGTDLNPGSSPLFSTAMALALSVRLNGLKAQEALTAGTVNAACALGLASAGRLEPGLPADFLVLHTADWRDLLYPLGANPVRDVWICGNRVVTHAVEEPRA